MNQENLSQWSLGETDIIVISIDAILIILSLLFFPFSLSISLLLFFLFIAIKILLKIFFCLKNKEKKKQSNLFLLALLLILIIKFFVDIFVNKNFFASAIFEDLYPVTIHDYLMVVIVFLCLKISPVRVRVAKIFFYCVILSTSIVFFNHYRELNFVLRSSMGFGNPNWLGLYCTICLPLILSMGLYKISQKRSLINILGLSYLFISLVLTLLMLLSSGSKSALLVSLTILVLTFVLFIYRIENKFIKRYVVKLATVLISIFALTSIFFVILNKTYFPVLNRLFDLEDISNIYRIEFYKCYFSLGVEKPLFGWGIRHSAQVCEARLGYSTGQINHAHNFILQLFADNGIVVLTLVLVGIFYFFLIPSFRYILDNRATEIPYVFYGFTLASLAIVMVSLFQSAFYHYPLFPLWLGFFWAYQHTFITQRVSRC